MTIYAVGDIQGCYNALGRGLDKIRFDPSRDQLWCTGDLVNRGGQSTLTLKLLYSMRTSVKTVLGNHDLYLLMARYADKPGKINDDLQQVLEHEDADKWCNWLRRQPLYHHHPELNVLLVHAGLPHIWTLEQSKDYAHEASAAISASDNSDFWNRLFGDKPKSLKPEHTGMDRHRIIINYFTRMRFITPEGKLNLHRTEKPKPTPQVNRKGEIELPWYAYPRMDHYSLRILFGHWASLNGVLHGGACVNATALDTGCVWGGKLSFYNLDTGQVFTSKQKKKRRRM